MPTNVLRSRPDRPPAGRAPATGQAKAAPTRRFIELSVGRRRLVLQLLETRTADVIWRALPLFSIAETWGECLHFELPVEAGRERVTRLNAHPGEICYWSEDDRVMIGYGPTPISRPGEIRLMRPCNLWARAVGDVRVLAGIVPGEKVELRATGEPEA